MKNDAEPNNETFNDEGDEDSSDQPKEEYRDNVKCVEFSSFVVHHIDLFFFRDDLYEIDLFLEKKAEQRRGNRRRGKNGDTDLSGPDADRLVKRLIDQMKVAAEEDRIFNQSRQPATAKLLLLPLLEHHLCRADLTDYFLENGLLAAFKDWLSPLPDNSLPSIKIRESLIRMLQQVRHVFPFFSFSHQRCLVWRNRHGTSTFQWHWQSVDVPLQTSSREQRE